MRYVILRVMGQGETDAKDPLVSVVVPAYRVSQFIAATLDSILAQTFRNFEIIVVNDGSPDTEELERVLEPYRSRIVYLRQENRGLAEPGIRESGRRAANTSRRSTPTICGIPEHLAAQLAVLEADPSIDVVYADAVIFGDTPEAGKTVMELSPSRGEVTFERLVTRKCTVHVCVCLIRRDTLFRAGLFDPELRRTEDFDMWLAASRCAAAGFCYQRKVLGQYRRPRRQSVLRSCPHD